MLIYVLRIISPCPNPRWECLWNGGHVGPKAFRLHRWGPTLRTPWSPQKYCLCTLAIRPRRAECSDDHKTTECCTSVHWVQGSSTGYAFVCHSVQVDTVCLLKHWVQCIVHWVVHWAQCIIYMVVHWVITGHSVSYTVHWIVCHALGCTLGTVYDTLGCRLGRGYSVLYTGTSR